MNTNVPSIVSSMADRFGMSVEAFERTLRATVVPPNTSKEEFAAFCLVAKTYGLNPVTREIFAMQKQGGALQPIVSVHGWANILNSHPQFDGLDFIDHPDAAGNVAAITCRIYRKDRSHPIEATEYLVECMRPTQPWKQWPRRMLRHKAMIQAARYAFGFAGIIDPDEYDRRPAPQPPTPQWTPPPARANGPQAETAMIEVLPEPSEQFSTTVLNPESTPIEAPQEPQPPPHDPETGELYHIPMVETVDGSHVRDWGGAFVIRVEQMKTLDEVERLLEANRQVLDRLKEEAPKFFARIEIAIGRRKVALAQEEK